MNGCNFYPNPWSVSHRRGIRLNLSNSYDENTKRGGPPGLLPIKEGSTKHD